MGNIPFLLPKTGGNPIETWYAEGMDFCLNIIAIGSNFQPRRASYIRYPICDTPDTHTQIGLIPGVDPTSHDHRGPRINRSQLREDAGKFAQLGVRCSREICTHDWESSNKKKKKRAALLKELDFASTDIVGEAGLAAIEKLLAAIEQMYTVPAASVPRLVL